VADILGAIPLLDAWCASWTAAGSAPAPAPPESCGYEAVAGEDVIDAVIYACGHFCPCVSAGREERPGNLIFRHALAD